ncbi:hypothetical protein GGF43_003570, partial [Coemansia sp. RSA 2618]
MTAVNRLPVDVIQRIIAYESPRINRHLLDWRNALRLISVSRAWRTAGLDPMYRTAFITDALWYSRYYEPHTPALYDPEYGGIPAPTNIKLAQQVSYSTRRVRRLVLEGCDSPNLMSIILCAIDVLALTDANCPGVSALKEWSRTSFHYSEPRKTLERDCFACVVRTASFVVQMFPGVRELACYTKGSGDMQLVFLNELLYLYVGQLTHVVFRGPAYFPQLVSGPKLASIDLALDPLEGWAAFPRLDMLSLKSIKLSLAEGVPLEWSIFQQHDGLPCVSNEERNDEGTSFGSLKYLKIGSAKIDYPPEIHGRLTQAQFPQLSHLRVSGNVFSAIDIACLSSSPIKCLELTGPADHMPTHLSNFTLLFPCLRRLKFDFGYIGVTQMENDFITQSNRIFEQTRGIEEVHVRVYPSKALQHEELVWSHVTHIEVVDVPEFAVITAAVARIP